VDAAKPDCDGILGTAHRLDCIIGHTVCDSPHRRDIHD
jgi:hypothetical protein